MTLPGSSTSTAAGTLAADGAPLMNWLFTFYEWALQGVFGRRLARLSEILLLALIIVAAQYAPRHDIVWLVTELGKWRAAPFLHIFQQLHYTTSSH